MQLSITPKRWLLIVHIIFAAIMLGNMVTFLILSITAAATENPGVAEACYQAMNVLSGTSVVASTIGATVTGIFLSVFTKWGLFNYYWIIAKEGLTLLAIGLNLWAMHAWTLEAISLTSTTDNSLDIFVIQSKLFIGIIIQILSLVIMYVISVFKPWGKRVVRSV
ncbi:hypothetical protein [Alkalihalobacillus sp. AL-G]|uniref:hypothetical protein n=1 Tax=Alkalihalobacillus sp. AL-G TaxID=2926399 RepID=UPI00272A9E7D|nr:hypothetical protein [Alkalihalobacillus sp. AL-G]WLD91676.1 hypothetical protein MOJ78_11535 [Alkalihalobacillus sp. AL-G]